jgi:hypothetical protein
MVSSSFRCKIASLVLAGALLVPLASAAAPGVRSERGAMESLLAQIWSAIVAVWSPESLDNGCGVDPYGRCAEQQVEPETDNGCGWDPYGGCRSGS